MRRRRRSSLRRRPAKGPSLATHWPSSISWERACSSSPRSPTSSLATRSPSSSRAAGRTCPRRPGAATRRASSWRSASCTVPGPPSAKCAAWSRTAPPKPRGRDRGGKFHKQSGWPNPVTNPGDHV
ncbi:hypothetical protein T492DRAFT_909788 [Pavlovales sp. CCMP2436]|nr:hypothetical protein T492DRAFT_909788 [Pavlovales sp. CCMP2436]